MSDETGWNYPGGRPRNSKAAQTASWPGPVRTDFRNRPMLRLRFNHFRPQVRQAKVLWMVASMTKYTEDYYPHSRARHRPKTIIDWRGELCRFLQLSHDPPDEDILDALEEAEENLRVAEILKSRFDADPGPLRYQVVYTIDCRLAPAKDRDIVYLDTPWPVDSGPYHSHLRGSRAIKNLELYLERERTISFLVFREYSCCFRKIRWQQFSDSPQSKTEELSRFFSKEYFEPVSANLRTALEDLSVFALYDIPHPRFDGKKPGKISYPYLWWYHRRRSIDREKKKMEKDLQKHVPEEVVVAMPEPEVTTETRGFMASGWLKVADPDSDSFLSWIEASFWIFDGSFYSTSTRVDLSRVPAVTSTKEFDIWDLPVHPLRFAKDHIEIDTRFMVDMETYNKMHPESRPSKNQEPGKLMSHWKAYPVVKMTDESLPGNYFLMCLPSTIPGFDMNEKEWKVDRMREVRWNDQAFEELVINPMTKDLVKAVVTNLVLLDEADVFLEQRTLANLDRNALVSVFLRILEYYDGVLILTTNRVGTFDEAFKSRIQLNLRYSNLDAKQRLTIWSNFITRVEQLAKNGASKSTEYGIDSDQIRKMLPALAEENLNGREIRNAISTARQLCLYKQEPLNYEHLRDVIEETRKFEEYLEDLHGFSADEIQHDVGAR
ncbi:ATPase [Colletotrichum plurivorum]|uniref:ATPase n=1 Tax=Colletotrichum plurivorum TaxID=2175906 RepID=A0A8H6NEQ7_9PEZI|nr:ATPase [Colletotrichum plurivorum]